MKYILSYLSPFKYKMLLGFTFKTVGTLAELVLPYLLTHILENVIVTLRLSKVITYGIIMILFALLACVGNIVANRMASRVATEFSKHLRKDLFSKTLYLSAKDTDKFTIPSLESRITTDTFFTVHT